jgi:hypothetical protein
VYRLIGFQVFGVSLRGVSCSTTLYIVLSLEGCVIVVSGIIGSGGDFRSVEFGVGVT